MDHSILLILIVLMMAYLFDFINGFHDAANAIATIVTTGVLTPRQAVCWAAFFNLAALLFFNLMVAKTIGLELIDSSIIDTNLIFAALMGAISWSLLTWYYGLPSSSSNALIGGLAGAAIARGGIATLKMQGLIKIVIGIFLAPLVGILVGFLLTFLVSLMARNQPENGLDRLFKGLQLVSSALLSLTHGGNDAQKTMGIITILLFSNAWLVGEFYVPFWVIVSCQVVISLGTLTGGWRIVKTVGTKITTLTTLRGCTAQTSAAAIIFIATTLGIPVSTTQTVTGSIAGVGLSDGLGGINWSMIKTIFISWLITLPIAGGMAYILARVFLQ